MRLLVAVSIVACVVGGLVVPVATAQERSPLGVGLDLIGSKGRPDRPLVQRAGLADLVDAAARTTSQQGPTRLNMSLRSMPRRFFALDVEGAVDFASARARLSWTVGESGRADERAELYNENGVAWERDSDRPRWRRYEDSAGPGSLLKVLDSKLLRHVRHLKSAAIDGEPVDVYGGRLDLSRMDRHGDRSDLDRLRFRVAIDHAQRIRRITTVARLPGNDLPIRGFAWEVNLSDFGLAGAELERPADLPGA